MNSTSNYKKFGKKEKMKNKKNMEKKIKKNMIRCGRCGRRHNIGSKQFLKCAKYTRNKIRRNQRETIQIKGSGNPGGN